MSYLDALKRNAKGRESEFVKTDIGEGMNNESDAKFQKQWDRMSPRKRRELEKRFEEMEAERQSRYDTKTKFSKLEERRKSAQQAAMRKDDYKEYTKRRTAEEERALKAQKERSKQEMREKVERDKIDIDIDVDKYFLNDQIHKYAVNEAFDPTKYINKDDSDWKKKVTSMETKHYYMQRYAMQQLLAKAQKKFGNDNDKIREYFRKMGLEQELKEAVSRTDWEESAAYKKKYQEDNE